MARRRRRSEGNHPRLGVAIALAGLAAGSAAAPGRPPPADPFAEGQRICYALSAEIGRLSDVQPGTAGFWSRTDNQAAGVLTVIAPVPALGYLGYNAYHGLQKDRIAHAASARIRELRRALAERQCFVR